MGEGKGQEGIRECVIHTYKHIEENLERDKFFTPEEAKEFGIVDDVVVHRIEDEQSEDITTS